MDSCLRSPALSQVYLSLTFRFSQTAVVKADSPVAVYRHEYDEYDQWFYIHKNIIFLVIDWILKHVLFRLMQKYLTPVINCLLCCMNWYSCGVIRSSHRIRTRSHLIRIVVKFYNHTLRLWSRCIPMRHYPPLVLF